LDDVAVREGKERDARKACLEGDYSKGVSLLSELFVDYKAANYVFNQGRCYEQNGLLEEAITRFREYLRLGPDDRDTAEKHIAECEELLRRKSLASAPAPTPAPMVATEPVAAQTPPVPAQVTAGATAQATPPSASRGSGLRISGVVLGVVGVAGIAAGLAMNLKANSLASQIEPPNHTFDRGTESSRKTYEQLSWVGYGVGAAAMVTGTILYGVGWARGNDSKQVALLPLVTPEMSGAAVKGAF
jgi:tetratricopeptide (TPR) repeat protein